MASWLACSQTFGEKTSLERPFAEFTLSAAKGSGVTFLAVILSAAKNLSIVEPDLSFPLRCVQGCGSLRVTGMISKRLTNVGGPCLDFFEYVIFSLTENAACSVVSPAAPSTSTLPQPALTAPYRHCLSK